MIAELVRLIIVAFITAIFVYLLQPWLFQSGSIALFDVEVEEWLPENYMPGASIVFGAALIAIALWYLSARRSKIKAFKDASPMRLVWALFLLIPVIGIAIALSFFNTSGDALLWLTSLYVFDVLLLYWFGSALSSPGLLKFVPPFSFQIRSLLGLK